MLSNKLFENRRVGRAPALSSLFHIACSYLLFSLQAFPCGSDGKKKKSACNAGDPSSVPGQRRYPLERNENSLQYSYMENSMETSGRIQFLGFHRVRHDSVTSTPHHITFILHMVIYIYFCTTLSICPTLFFPYCVYMSVLHFCISIAVLPSRFSCV